jgi:hypothetical protein
MKLTTRFWPETLKFCHSYFLGDFYRFELRDRVSDKQWYCYCG